MVLFLVLYLYLKSINGLQPYKSTFLNFTDSFAMFAAIMTLLCGIFFIEADTAAARSEQLVIFFGILIFNGIFLIYWFIRMCIVLFTKLKTKVRKDVRDELIEEFKDPGE